MYIVIDKMYLGIDNVHLVPMRVTKKCTLVYKMYLGIHNVHLAPMRVTKKCTLVADAPWECGIVFTICNLVTKLQIVSIKMQIVINKVHLVSTHSQIAPC